MQQNTYVMVLFLKDIKFVSNVERFCFVSKITNNVQGVRIWCLTAVSIIFPLNHGGQFYWWGNLIFSFIGGGNQST